MTSIIPRMGRLYSTAAVSANSVTQLVAPQSNPGGLIIRTCQLIANPSSSSVQGLSLMADSVAPTTADPARRVVLNVSQATTAIEYGVAQLPHPLFVDPGNGLWILSNGGGGGGVCMTYDLLGLTADA